MLNKFITNMKEKSLRKKSEQVEDMENELKVGENSEPVNDGKEATEEEKKQKRNSMIIRVVVVIALAYFFVTEFVLKEKPENVIPPVAVKTHRPKKEVLNEVATEQQAKPVKEVPSEIKNETKQTENQVQENSPPSENQMPIENINIADKKMEPVLVPKVEEKAIPEETSVTSSSQMGEVKTPESQVDKKIDSLIDSVDNAGKGQEEKTKKQEVSLEDKIVADDVYTPPPSYEQLGRGLVYNCKEKYWACLDKSSYVTCNKNNKWNKAHGKALECVVQNVYSSDDDCGVIQKYNVSTSKPTTFCSEH